MVSGSAKRKKKRDKQEAQSLLAALSVGEQDPYRALERGEALKV
jgi:hypothetical protein